MKRRNNRKLTIRKRVEKRIMEYEQLHEERNRKKTKMTLIK